MTAHVLTQRPHRARRTDWSRPGIKVYRPMKEKDVRRDLVAREVRGLGSERLDLQRRSCAD